MKLQHLKLSSVFAALLLTLNAPHAVAKDLPFSDAYQAQIFAGFYEGVQISKAKTDAYIARLDKKRSEIKKILKQQPNTAAGDDADSGDDGDGGGKLSKDLKVAMQNLHAAESAPTRLQQFNLIQSALDIEGSIRIEGSGIPLLDSALHAQHVFTTRKISKVSSAANEAVNLFDPATNSYLSVGQIQALKNQGHDLSAYGPGPNSPFWQPVDIAHVNGQDASQGRDLGIYGSDPLFPSDTSVFYYKDVKHSQTVPKIDVYALQNGKKIKYKLKMGGEMNAGPTAATLMMTLGFPAEVSEYLHHNIRVELGKNTIDDFKREWEVYYSRDGVKPYKIEGHIVGQGQDRQGNYVIFKDGMIEAKPKTVERVGGWAFADNDHSNFREVRAAAFVQMFLDNSDLKEFDNNRLILTKGADGSIQRHLMVSDVGHSLGWLILETPDLYNWNMVSKSSGATIDFNYRSLQKVSIISKITYDDARWATRLIARLSRAQFAAAVAAGGWPDCVQKSYTERMISRRNDLVTQFGLTNEVPMIPIIGTHEDYAYATICEAATKPANTNIHDTYSSDYDGTLTSILLKPGATAAGQALLGAIQGAIASQQRIVLSSANFRLDPRMISAIIITPSRLIERNPNPKSENDIQIVEDSIELGLRLGVAFGGYADVIYTRKYSLAYPMRDATDASLNNGFIVNALLSFDVHNDKLPASYVLKTEHYLENGAGVEEDYKPSPISPVIKAGVSHINLWRSIYDHRDLNHLVLYRDHSLSNGFKMDDSLRTLFVDWPVFSELSTWGHANGKGLIFSEADLQASDTLDHAVLHAVIAGDFSALHPKEIQFNTVDEFKETLKKWNFLFWSWTNQNRLDTFTVAESGMSKTSVQYRSNQSSTFSFASNNESKSAQIEAYTSPATPSIIDLKVKVVASDVATSDEELQRYLNFINGLSIDGKKIIPFDPKLGYTTNGKWGATVTRSETDYTPAAVASLLAASPTTVWQAIADAAGVSAAHLVKDYMNYRQYQAASAGPRSGPVSPATYGLNQDRILLVTAAAQISAALKSAQNDTTLENKVKHLAQVFRAAIYVDSTGFYTPVVLQALNRMAGIGGFVSQNLITVPAFKEVNMIADSPLYGEIGQAQAGTNKYMMFTPITPIDLYTIFDTWF